jgi:hypothetical protein
MSIELQRLRYWQGQLLRSGDFHDQTVMAAQLRWWHNRALHDSFGVSWGFSITPVPQSGQLQAVRVGCGLAYDCYGRELILQNPMTIEVPASGQGAMTLLVLYKETAEFPQGNGVSGACPGSGRPLPEKPEFVWKLAGCVTPRDGVPLAEVNGSGMLKPTSPLARPLARPHIASGATIAGNTAWELWSVTGAGKQPIPLGFQVRVDTVAAGFAEPPVYFARLHGSLWNPRRNQFIPAPLAHVAEPATDGFLFRLWLPEVLIIPRPRTTANQNFTNNFLAFARKQGLFVSWLGIEPRPV